MGQDFRKSFRTCLNLPYEFDSQANVMICYSWNRHCQNSHVAAMFHRDLGNAVASADAVASMPRCEAQFADGPADVLPPTVAYGKAEARPKFAPKLNELERS